MMRVFPGNYLASVCRNSFDRGFFYFSSDFQVDFLAVKSDKKHYLKNVKHTFNAHYKLYNPNN